MAGTGFRRRGLILANIPLASPFYKGEINRSATWDVGFTTLLINRLAEKFGEAAGASEIRRSEDGEVRDAGRRRDGG